MKGGYYSQDKFGADVPNKQGDLYVFVDGKRVLWVTSKGYAWRKPDAFKISSTTDYRFTQEEIEQQFPFWRESGMKIKRIK